MPRHLTDADRRKCANNGPEQLQQLGERPPTDTQVSRVGVGGISGTSAFAVLRFVTSPYVVGVSTARSAGEADLHPVWFSPGPPNRGTMSPRLLHLTGIGIGEKLLLAVDLKGFDGVLPLGRQHPVNECLALGLFHVRVFGRVD
jgi:hypothetical protein